MDKLSEYVPLLIIIVSVIISIVGKKKRPAKEIMLPQEVFPVPQPPFFEFEKPLPEKKIVKPVAPKVQMPEKKQHAVYERPVEVQDNQDNDEYEGNNFDFSAPEEMKKAIIYSEIFNRRDF
ncbi:hypothetical protein FACS1894177_02970 [Bacteroidia bacterium]|nr:hypothetical protein FACS1894177_02970 [Bacteroidia bacterium]